MNFNKNHPKNSSTHRNPKTPHGPTPGQPSKILISILRQHPPLFPLKFPDFDSNPVFWTSNKTYLFKLGISRNLVALHR